MSKPILKVNVDITGVGSVPLIIHENDDPEQLVLSFAAPYSMDESTISALIDHVKSSIQSLVPDEARKNALRYSRPTTSMTSSRGRGGRLWSGGRKPPPVLTGSFLGSPPQAKTADSFRHKTPVSGPNGLLGAAMAKEQPPSVRHRASTPTHRSQPVITDKLYEDAAWIRERRELMRQRAEYLRSEQEMENVTFKPVLNPRSLEYINKANDVGTFGGSGKPDGHKTIDYQLKQLEKHQAEISECTFHPCVTRKSPPLRPGQVFEELYEEAQRRQERREYFQHPMARTVGEAAVEVTQTTPRRTLSIKESEQLVHRLSRGLARSCPATPRTFAATSTLSRSIEMSTRSFSSTVAKGRALYAAAMERREQREKTIAEIQKAEMKSPEICSHSKAILEEKKRRVFKELFNKLSDGADTLPTGISTTKLEDVRDFRLRELVRPIVEYVSQHTESDFPITFDRFVAALEVRLSQAAGPTANIFVESAATPQRGRPQSVREREKPPQSFRPQLSARTNLRRDANVPLHEALWKSQEVKEARLRTLRQEQEKAEISECTFRPSLSKPFSRN